MDNELILNTGEDIPFIEAQISIHQPKIWEISLIGEREFLSGCQFFTITKEKLKLEGRNDLADMSDFEIFMSIMRSKEKIEYRNAVMMILALIFPEYQIHFTENEILLANQNFSTRINNKNYNNFKDIIISMFILDESNDPDSGEYNPADKKALKIAEKLKKHKEKIARDKGIDTNKVAIFSRYISILSVGLQKDKNILKNYTVFQLKDELKRFQKKQSWDMYIKAKFAGAQDLDEVDNWMDNIHS